MGGGSRPIKQLERKTRGSQQQNATTTKTDQTHKHKTQTHRSTEAHTHTHTEAQKHRNTHTFPSPDAFSLLSQWTVARNAVGDAHEKLKRFGAKQELQLAFVLEHVCHSLNAQAAKQLLRDLDAPAGGGGRGTCNNSDAILAQVKLRAASSLRPFSSQLFFKCCHRQQHLRFRFQKAFELAAGGGMKSQPPL